MSAVVQFSARIGTRLLRGVVMENDEAKKQYDSAVAAGKRVRLPYHLTPVPFNSSTT